MAARADDENRFFRMGTPAVIADIVTGADAQVLAANPRRKGLILQCTHATVDTRVTLDGSAATASKGLLVVHLANPIILGAECGLLAVRAFSAGSTLSITEIT